MCPNAFCEEHLPGNASIVKTCQRFSLLGYKHAKTACYIICSAGCVATSKQQGVLEASRHVSAGGILGSAGVDLTKGAAEQFDRRTDWDKLPPAVQVALKYSLSLPPSHLAAMAPGFLRKCVAGIDELHSTLDMLHDVLFNTSIYTQRDRSVAPDVMAKIGSWRGVADYHPYEPPPGELQLTDFEAQQQVETAKVANSSFKEKENTQQYCEFLVFAAVKQTDAGDNQKQIVERIQVRQQAAATEFLRLVRALEAMGKQYRGMCVASLGRLY